MFYVLTASKKDEEDATMNLAENGLASNAEAQQGTTVLAILMNAARLAIADSA